MSYFSEINQSTERSKRTSGNEIDNLSTERSTPRTSGNTMSGIISHDQSKSDSLIPSNSKRIKKKRVSDETSNQLVLVGNPSETALKNKRPESMSQKAKNSTNTVHEPKGQVTRGLNLSKKQTSLISIEV